MTNERIRALCPARLIFDKANMTVYCCVRVVLIDAGLTAEEPKTVGVPPVKEAFLTLECAFESAQDLSGKGIVALVIGRVTHAAVEDGFCAPDKICSPEGFMFNVHTPKNPLTGEGSLTAIALLKAKKYV